MQVPAAAHRPGQGTLRNLLVVAVLLVVGVCGGYCVEAHLDGQAEASASLAAVATLAVIAGHGVRRTGGLRSAPRHCRGALRPVGSVTVPVLAMASRGHPRSRRGPPSVASHPSTCA